MSMSTFLIASNNARPQAAFGDGPSDSKELKFANHLLAAGYAIPLMWLFLFSKEDLMEHPINKEEDRRPEQRIQIPCCGMLTAAARLESRLPLINDWFGSKGKLDYHVTMFAEWLRSLPYKYVTLEWAELNFMDEETFTLDYFTGILDSIETADRDIIPELVALSTINPEVPFITLDDARNGGFDEAKKHNFFFLMGDGEYHTPPWS
jgi:hypothetical protein